MFPSHDRWWRQPLAQPQAPQFTNQLGRISPVDVLNFRAQNFGTFAQASRPFAVQNSQGPSPFFDIASRGVGGIAGGIGLGLFNRRQGG